MITAGRRRKRRRKEQLEMWANAQRDGRLPNIGGAVCSTPQFG